jgi:hypothetical protein
MGTRTRVLVFDAPLNNLIRKFTVYPILFGRILAFKWEKSRLMLLNMILRLLHANY